MKLKRYFPYLYDKDENGNEEYSVVVEENSTGKYVLYEDHKKEIFEKNNIIKVHKHIEADLRATNDEMLGLLEKAEACIRSLASESWETEYVSKEIRLFIGRNLMK